ncbi:hypothetical protein APSETT445_001492 [Aspergillus pseudonomiae]
MRLAAVLILSIRPLLPRKHGLRARAAGHLCHKALMALEMLAKAEFNGVILREIDVVSAAQAEGTREGQATKATMILVKKESKTSTQLVPPSSCLRKTSNDDSTRLEVSPTAQSGWSQANAGEKEN